MEDRRIDSQETLARRAHEAVVRFIGVLAVALLAGSVLFSAWSFFRCFSEARLVPDYPQYPMVRVLFYGSGRGSVSARFSLYDTAGREFCVIDRSWTAQSLSVDFTTASFGGRTFVFPFKIRPSESSRGGTALSHYFLDRRRCMLLGSPCTDRQRLALFHLAVFAIDAANRFQTRFSSIRTLNLGQCEMGKTYDILVDSAGSLSLVSM